MADRPQVKRYKRKQRNRKAVIKGKGQPGPSIATSPLSPPSPTQPNELSIFMLLPLELRDEIYTYTAASDNQLTMKPTLNYQLIIRNRGQNLPRCGQKNPMHSSHPFARACKQINVEYREALWRCAVDGNIHFPIRNFDFRPVMRLESMCSVSERRRFRRQAVVHVDVTIKSNIDRTQARKSLEQWHEYCLARGIKTMFEFVWISADDTMWGIMYTEFTYWRSLWHPESERTGLNGMAKPYLEGWERCRRMERTRVGVLSDAVWDMLCEKIWRAPILQAAALLLFMVVAWQAVNAGVESWQRQGQGAKVWPWLAELGEGYASGR